MRSAMPRWHPPRPPTRTSRRNAPSGAGVLATASPWQFYTALFPFGTRAFARVGRARYVMPKERTDRQERKAAQREAAERAKRRNVLLLRGALLVLVLGAV